MSESVKKRIFSSPLMGEDQGEGEAFVRAYLPPHPDLLPPGEKGITPYLHGV